MKARFGDVEVDGSAEEVAALIRALGGGDATKSTDASDAKPTGKFVSEDVAFKALRRRAMSKEQQAVIRTLVRNHPGWTTAAQLQAATKYSPSQLAGLLGAFGKRVYATPGYKKGAWFFDQEWNYEEGANQYRLPEAVIAAAKRVQL